MILLAIDPGETVGWSVWDTEKYVKLAGGQTPRVEFADQLATQFLADPSTHMGAPFEAVDQIVCEDWQIYPREAKAGALDWDKCLTARTIGAIQQLARMAEIPVSFQGAVIKEPAMAMGAQNYFVTPLTPNRHENDSTMHAVYFMVKTLNA